MALVVSLLASGCFWRHREPAPPELPLYRPADRALSSEVCIERPRNEGALNVRDARVFVTTPQSFALLGGQAVCTFVAPGSYSVMASSHDPYDPTSEDDKAWTSEPVHFDVGPSELVRLELLPGKDGRGGWTLRRTDVHD
ncbi:MAG TPA: hypothetical protein VFD84_15215 [Candidatus Binatia bacterium]|nr:hypothetical protein [Candidatus Binatia bacterium]